MYYYETLGDERFQEFCQSLIAASFPNAQCLPVGQPDGGRDAYLVHNLRSQRHRASSREIIVFQVKFAKNPLERSERETIESLVKTEGPKIERLKKLGMSKYYLLTNVKGTSHLDVGSIDRVNKSLSEAFNIEAYCWWRDDLDRRLDNNSSIKWSYPETLKATDLFEKLVSGLLGEEEERRRGALRAYLTSQYEEDEELKFKQTDLRSTMTDLFVDLPMRFSSLTVGRSHSVSPNRLVAIRNNNPWAMREEFEFEEDTFKAARFFAEAKGTSRHSRIVLEGAPGQGKSTVTQFICQILRMKLLNKELQLSALPPHFRSSPARIPFRVDLRDLAKWLAGIDPFVSRSQSLPEQEPRSLEGFLAGQVRFLSGGHVFNVSDLTAVARASHILLALDGFDEVADISLRQKLVDEITKGTNRLINAGGYSLQTIVTSRPAAFAKSVRFPSDQWGYYELLPLESEQIEEYAGKWMKAKGLKEVQRAQLKALIDVKLKEAHTQFLAKNPMQLTILLSLMNSRGASLPDKRTAMYDAYMDMFFSRESEKSEIVRDNRDLLIDIHRYLAWKLQIGAEAGDNGSIEQGALKATLFSYLDKEGENTGIVNSLFDGMIERVGALVSRVQGTYEFEVQPLREYFSARHLYETAPYPNDDRPRSGDKFDRFRALVSNPYWLNVARFYGGCFNKGEILALVNELMEIGNKPPYSLTTLPRSTSLMLLADWVFNQYQPAVKQILSFIGEYPQFRCLLANAETHGESLWANLPERSGRADFLSHLWSRLRPSTPTEEQRAIANAISQNSTFEERATKWGAISDSFNALESARIAGFLGLFSDKKYVADKLKTESPTDELIETLINYRHLPLLNDAGLTDRAIKLMSNLAVGGMYTTNTSPDSELEWFATMTSPHQYQLAFTRDGDEPLEILLMQRYAGPGVSPKENGRDQNSRILSTSVSRAVEAYKVVLATPISELATNIIPWTSFVESAREAWGDCPAIDRIAFTAAGIRNRNEPGRDAPLEETGNLVATARYMRLKSGAPQWWNKLLSARTTSEASRRILLMLFIWGTGRTLIQLSIELEQSLSMLTDSDWRILYRDVKLAVRNDDNRNDRITSRDIGALKSKSSRFLTMIGLRTSVPVRAPLALELAERDLAYGSPEVQFSFSTMAGLREKLKSGKVLDGISSLYLKGASMMIMDPRERQMDRSVAEKISSAAGKFPFRLLVAADRQLTSIAASHAPKMHEISLKEKWFEEQSSM